MILSSHLTRLYRRLAFAVLCGLTGCSLPGPESLDLGVKMDATSYATPTPGDVVTVSFTVVKQGVGPGLYGQLRSHASTGGSAELPLGLGGLYERWLLPRGHATRSACGWRVVGGRVALARVGQVPFPSSIRCCSDRDAHSHGHWSEL